MKSHARTATKIITAESRVATRPLGQRLRARRAARLVSGAMDHILMHTRLLLISNKDKTKEERTHLMFTARRRRSRRSELRRTVAGGRAPPQGRPRRALAEGGSVLGTLRSVFARVAAAARASLQIRRLVFDALGQRRTALPRDARHALPRIPRTVSRFICSVRGSDLSLPTRPVTPGQPLQDGA